MDKAYIDTVRLLLETAPAIFRAPFFAMKGGTAINLFVQDMPRLSVDIDVVFTDYTMPRASALEAISAALKDVTEQLKKRGLEARVAATNKGDEIKVFVQRERLQVKIEVNHVFRGTILPVANRRLVDTARSLFTTELTVPTLAPAELYGSKLVAALDRQHPRDFYDVLKMYDQVGLTAEIVESFVSYLAGHNRPVHEVLFSNDLDLKTVFENEFRGMAREPVELADLVDVRHRLRAELPRKMTPAHRAFLLGLVKGEPDWAQMSCPHLSQLPAIHWKLQNLAKLKKSNATKFAQQTSALRSRL
jgi:predicted nucleotidyltransferase component of viral defense system